MLPEVTAASYLSTYSYSLEYFVPVLRYQKGIMGNEESLAPAEHGQRLNGGNLNAACPFIAE